MKNKLTIIALFGIFLLPPALSWYMYKFGNVEGGKRNNGTLLQPPRTLEDIQLVDLTENSSKPLYGKWSLVFFNSGPCAEACNEKLYKARQIRLAMSKYAHRLQRLVIINVNEDEFSHAVAKEYPGQLVVNMNGLTKGQLDIFSIQNGEDPFVKDNLFVIDPIGNVVMYYPSDADPIGIIEDLLLLLKISRIG